MCKNLSFTRIAGRSDGNTLGATAAGSNSKMAAGKGVNWAAILPADQLDTIPDRSSDD